MAQIGEEVEELIVVPITERPERIPDNIDVDPDLAPVPDLISA